MQGQPFAITKMIVQGIENTQLQVLHLTRLELTDSAFVSAFCEMIKNTPSLVELSLANSIFKLVHFTKITEVLIESLPKLQFLDLRGITALKINEKEQKFYE